MAAGCAPHRGHRCTNYAVARLAWRVDLGQYKVFKHTAHLLQPIHRHYSTRRAYTCIGLCLEAGLSADCGLASLWVHSLPEVSEVK